MSKPSLKIIFTLYFLGCLIGCQSTTNRTDFFLRPSNPDMVITTTILESMLQDELLSTIKIHVETTGGIVALTGYVKTIRQSDLAEEIARTTPGVRSVQNNIIVRK